MSSGWQIEITQAAKKQLKKLDKQVAKHILNYLNNHIALCSNPEELAKPLKGNWANLWRYRVGHYRIICDIQKTTITIVVLRIAHRKNIYKK